MKIPIPNDWDGQTWSCYKIYWPKSDQWLGQLLGALTLYQRGRYWDEETGSVIAAKAVGQQIFDHNYPLLKCSGDAVVPGEESTDTARVVRVALGLWELECDDMACIDISDLLKIENGVLYALDNCCNWVPIGSISGTASVPPIDNPFYDPTADPAQEWSGCGKARSVIEAIGQLVTYMWDFGTTAGLREVETGIRGNFPQWTMDRLAIYGAWAAWQAYELIPEYNKAVAMAIQELAICKLAVQMEDSKDVSDDEYNHVRSSIRSAAYELYSSSPLVAPNAQDIYQMWDWCADIIGTNDLKTVMVIGSADLDATCECPGTPPPPNELDWYHDWDFTLSSQDFPDPGSTGNYVAGQGWMSEEFAGYDINLLVNGPTKAFAQQETIAVTYAQITYATDAWVSGVRSTKVRINFNNNAFVEMAFDPSQDGQKTLEWNGFLEWTWTGSASNVTIEFVRDECGPDAYACRVQRLILGGLGFDPVPPPTDP